MSPRTLVAGIGNVFFRDDGFGVAVARYLMSREPSNNVVVRDVGIRGLHLAYDLMEGWDLLIAVDAVSMGDRPGTLHLIEPSDLALTPRAHDAQGAHGMDLSSILTMARSLGAPLPEVRVVGCDVIDVEEGFGLTAEVERAVPEAARMVETVIRAHVDSRSASTAESSTPVTKEP